MRAQYKINFDPPPFKKLPEALIISPELQHLDRQKDTNRNLDQLYITRPKRLGTNKQYFMSRIVVNCHLRLLRSWLLSFCGTKPEVTANI